MNDYINLLEYKCSKIQTKLAKTESIPYKENKSSRWNFDELYKESEYLDYIAKKAFTPNYSINNNNSLINKNINNNYKVTITEPHRIYSYKPTTESINYYKIKKNNNKINNFKDFTPKKNLLKKIEDPLEKFVDEIQEFSKW